MNSSRVAIWTMNTEHYPDHKHHRNVLCTNYLGVFIHGMKLFQAVPATIYYTLHWFPQSSFRLNNTDEPNAIWAWTLARSNKSCGASVTSDLECWQDKCGIYVWVRVLKIKKRDGKFLFNLCAYWNLIYEIRSFIFSTVEISNKVVRSRIFDDF